MRKRTRPESSKTYHNKYNDISLGFDKENKSKIIAKIVDNYQDLKCCVPMDLTNAKRT